jgi:CHAT domain-containing protein
MKRTALLLGLWLAIAPPAIAQDARQLLRQGMTQYQANQLEAALQSWKQALTAFQQLKDLQGEGETLGALGAGYLSLGKPIQARDYTERFLTIAQRRRDPAGQAQAFANLGIINKNLGSYAAAIALQNQALALMRSQRYRQAEGQLLLNLGNTYDVIGNYEEAQVAFEQSLAIARQFKDLRGESTALTNLGTLSAKQGNSQQALTFYQPALKLAEATQDVRQQISLLINAGTAHHGLRQRDQAIANYQRGLQLAEQFGDRKLHGEVLSNLGLIYEDEKDFTKAIQAHQQSVAIAQASQNPRAEALARNNLGHTLFYAGKLKDAEQNLRSAIALLDRLRSGLSDFDQVNIFDTQVFTYNLLQQVLIANHQPEAALEASEQGRARAFAQLLASRLNPDPQKTQAAVLAAPTIGQIRKIAQQQQATLVSYSIIPDEQFKFRGKLRAREAELFIWVVKPNGQVAFRRVDLKPLWQQQMTLQNLVEVSRCLAPTPVCPTIPEYVQSKPKQLDTAPYYPGLKELHQLLIAPIADLLPKNSGDLVVFIPQESLFLVPFAALQDSKDKFLIQQHTIAHAPSIQVLDLTYQQRQRAPNSTSALVVGNPTMPKVVLKAGQPPEQLKPLPGSEQEAEEIALLLKSRPLIGAQATKANVLRQLTQAKYIHLATHGLLEYGSQRLTSGVPGAIALSPDRGDSGLLTSTEILNLRLNADLVVLSACDTGQGRITGDGVIGLSRAWISANVPSVIVSLWAVPDVQTAALMTAFYRNLQTQPDKAQSLRQAMLTTMEEYPQPLDWAAFTLIGESR